MRISVSQLKKLIREQLLAEEEIANVGTPHKQTRDTTRVLTSLKQNKALSDLLTKINTRDELVGLLQAIVDATGTTKDTIIQAVNQLAAHEKKS